jgi:hypothetical protein
MKAVSSLLPQLTFWEQETVPWKDPVTHKELLLKELEVLKLPQM